MRDAGIERRGGGRARGRGLGTLAVLAGLVALATGGCATDSGPGTPAPAPTTRPAAAATSRSDAEAIALADLVMDRLGGQEAWDRTHYVVFRFFGGRRHVWDRHTGDIRIEGTDRESGQSYVVLMNVRTRTGRAWSDGAPVEDAEERAAMVEGAYRAWINDTYWLVMPYKLRDPGVTLRALGPRAMEDGRTADVLELTFDGVGVTPQNRYEVYVARDSGLVEQWDFYAAAADAEPRFRTPWHGWRRYGEIMLSGDRGERELTEIAVHDSLPAAVLTDPTAAFPGR